MNWAAVKSQRERGGGRERKEREKGERKPDYTCTFRPCSAVLLETICRWFTLSGICLHHNDVSCVRGAVRHQPCLHTLHYWEDSSYSIEIKIKPSEVQPQPALHSSMKGLWYWLNFHCDWLLQRDGHCNVVLFHDLVIRGTLQEVKRHIWRVTWVWELAALHSVLETTQASLFESTSKPNF